MFGVMKWHDTDSFEVALTGRVFLAETMPRLRRPIENHLIVIASEFFSCKQFRVIRRYARLLGADAEVAAGPH